MTHFLVRFSSSNLHFRRGCASLRRLVFVIAALSANPPLHANTINVDDASSGSVAGKCTIQDAVTAANTNAAVNGCAAGSAGLDTIQFAAGISSIVLDTPMTPPAGSVSANCIYGLAISEDLSIDAAPVAGSGIAKVTIQRSASAATHFGVVGASIYDCGMVPGSKLKLTLSGLAIGNGNVDGLFNGNGGGITSDFLTINDSAISGNTATNGGGVYAYTSLSMNTSTVSNNTGTFSCAGICGSSLTIYGSTISGNSCAGFGGGGGISGSPVNIVNSTVSGNSAFTGSGSGIDTTALQATWVTITANKGTGWYLGVGGTSSLSNTVIVGNGDGSTTHDFDTSFSTTVGGDHNWIGTFSTVAHNDLDNGLLILGCATPGLAPLANNGGGTQTHALLPGSCLIDAGTITTPIPDTLIVNDQRGSGFARFVNIPSDIGAFEFQGDVTPVNGACGADNGQTLPIAPTHLCSAGIPSAVSGAGHPWSWTCASASGGTTATCSATIKTWTVSATTTSGGTISPASQLVDSGASAIVIVSPTFGYRITSVSGCGGTLNGNSYTTAAAIADCAITAVFSVAPAPSAPINVPVLSQWMLVLLGVALLGMAAVAWRRRLRV
ncbi:IPTL-CTERM sorting domain-containing protein [Pseudolysobacter antarcticus]|uniref:IPTL-CTERM sorting domain-containing protein n=1 Tax=Pseudolysobacter antarcticus TaxID=2511995 RepID=A0A411HFV6_9GAMM|nr:IPTL-CTERM sorting domain-containing protein [Pseudolysobacter antarcticus]QBB69386.1 IPTL-CTERM sorting domain-containing protein [Pseudolysobacter antarcticus]